MVQNNTAITGGAITTLGKDSQPEMEMMNVTFQNNSASDGGAMYLSGMNHAVIQQMICMDNQATAGGCMKCEQSASVEMEYGNITQNVASAEGGAFRIGGSCQWLERGSTLSDNVAERGGAYGLFGGSSVLFEVHMQSNRASRGGAMFTDLTNGEFELCYCSLE